MSNLPGSIRSLKAKGYKCDDHPEIDAIVRLQGETDSFGCEYIYMCEDCYNKYKQKPKEIISECDCCHTDDVELSPTRDIDEGLNGPVYYYCDNCISTKNNHVGFFDKMDYQDKGEDTDMDCPYDSPEYDEMYMRAEEDELEDEEYILVGSK